MMWCKAMAFRDNEIANRILSTDNVAIIKELERNVSGYDESDWNGQNLLGYTLMIVRERL